MALDINEQYRELDLPLDADLASVRDAYHQLVKVWHPDRFEHDPKIQATANNKLKRLNAAFQTIVAYLESRPHQSGSAQPQGAKGTAGRIPTSEDIYRLGLDRYFARDYHNALDFFLRSAKMGHASSQYAVGFMYYHYTPRNVLTIHRQRKNDRAALDWWAKAANQGHADAQYMLGIFHLYAYCTPYNESEARTWLERAASQGHPRAKERLAKMGGIHKLRAVPLASWVMESPPGAPLPR